uniref:Uncharacterized protein n=1 Tax=Caulerpa verticillata TaxID=177082 RepID=A0A386B0C8_9CHLO|nr:hypothetical protein [Caulerpa verticillata]AYC65147.1 hypothetical protein [Caulerpa verticillata]
MICRSELRELPFSGVQAQGIIYRRLLLVPFLKRVKPSQTKDFDIMFPENEIQNLVCFATKVSPTSIKNFLLKIKENHEMMEVLAEHYADNADESGLIQNFILEKLT